ncbi:cupin domain-containing protein [Candidatus Bathyarchaeota archaeon]|nr:cupin domain-containing protein [Candidatus Bathyarchaeota archaeon]
MKVVSLKGGVVEKRSGGIFTGEVEITYLVDPDTGSKEFRAAIVSFPKGVRNKFHVHDHEQILFVTEGRGIVATEFEEREVGPGDLIFIPAGEKHWHGATEESSFSHLYVMSSHTKTTY